MYADAQLHVWNIPYDSHSKWPSGPICGLIAINRGYDSGIISHHQHNLSVFLDHEATPLNFFGMGVYIIIDATVLFFEDVLSRLASVTPSKNNITAFLFDMR